MRFGSGSYDVRQSEGINPSLLRPINQRTVTCTVYFLDGTERQFTIDRHARGQELLEKVYAHLELVERDFFGLQFICILDTRDTQQKKWLEPQKSVRKQMLCPPYNLFFRVKFYVSDPAKLVEEYTRYHFFLQIRKDLLDGKLTCAEGSMALLGSYAVQSEFGDYNCEEMGEKYLDNFVVSPNQPIDLPRKIEELHRVHKGQSPAEAEFNFLDHAKRLEMYGVELYEASDGKGIPISVGVNAFGMLVFHEKKKVNEYPWSSIMKISFKRKQFFVNIRMDDGDEPEDRLIFNISTSPSCKQLWKSCIEHHTFFRLIAPPAPPPKGLFHIGSRFRYSGRTEFQTMEEMKRRARVERTFSRSTSKSSFQRATVSGVPSSTSSRAFTPQQTASPDLSSRLFSESSAPSLRGRQKETTFGVSEDDSEIEQSWTPNMMGTQACTSATVHHRPANNSLNGSSDLRKSAPNGNGYVNGYGSNGYASGSSIGSNGGFPSTGPSVGRFPLNGTLNGINGSSISGSLKNSPRLGGRAHHANIGTSSPRSSLASSYTSGYGGGVSPPRNRRSPQSHKSNSPVGEDSPVTVRMRPDAQGRFGFNVKGGSDQNYPVIVSRVASGSSADKCYPRLNEGDQVLMINGRDVSTMSHDQVVAFIRSARQSPNGGELVLTIRPNVYRLGEELPEPDASCVPESVRVSDTIPRSDKLSHSLRILNESLVSGNIVNQFEQLYRKKPGLSMSDCRLAANVNKNRYRDVCPYDATRVPLQSASSGDYINASFVNMEIPASGIVNRYIACQGPLAHTSADFWIMCWEQLCTTIVMLTTTVERGRVKCHQYWPRLYETQDYGRLTVTCLKDRETPNCSYREFSVKDRQSKEERRVTQMQYTAWPDHGVPDDPKHFIQFVDEVRRIRSGSVDPIVVHCSAGIGRTGVLILMETAAGLVEANEPVYPLDIVRIMRDQRAMAIQTPGQYTFVCESILRAYNDGTIKPLSEYQKR